MTSYVIFFVSDTNWFLNRQTPIQTLVTKSILIFNGMTLGEDNSFTLKRRQLCVQFGLRFNALNVVLIQYNDYRSVKSVESLIDQFWAYHSKKSKPSDTRYIPICLHFCLLFADHTIEQMKHNFNV